jgi:hypothetical protein
LCDRGQAPHRLQDIEAADDDVGVSGLWSFSPRKVLQFLASDQQQVFRNACNTAKLVRFVREAKRIASWLNSQFDPAFASVDDEDALIAKTICADHLNRDAERAGDDSRLAGLPDYLLVDDDGRPNGHVWSTREPDFGMWLYT